LCAAVGPVALMALGSSAMGQQAAAPAQKEWADQVKNPCQYFSWGADERIRQEYIQNPYFFNTDPPGHEWNFGRYRSRAWATVHATDWLDLNARLSWEWRYWEKPDSKDNTQYEDVKWDHLNIKIKPKDSPFSATIGRQDIILGDGWLVLEGSPLDGSTTISFDLAARFTFEFKDAKTTLDAIYIQQWSDPDHWMPAIASQDRSMMEQDERGLILYATNKSIERTEISPYFMYKHDDAEPYHRVGGTPQSGGDTAPMARDGNNGEIYTLGARTTHELNKNWKGKLEGAYQWGNRQRSDFNGGEGDDVSAWGFNSEIAYSFQDTWKNVLKLQFEHLSGDDRDTGTIESFYPLWARWPQWSEYYVYSFATETRIAEVTNLWRLGMAWQANPMDKMTLQAAYHALWADETRDDVMGFGDSSFRGHLITGVIRYKFNRYLSAHLMGEYFFTGDYYQEEGPRNDDDGAYARFELMVTF